MTRPLKTLFWLIALLMASSACQQQSASSAPVLARAGTQVSQLAGLGAEPALPRPTPTAVSEAIISAADAEYLLLTNLYERAAPSVVNIDATSAQTREGSSQITSGSGFIIDTDGHIVTSAHVIQGASSITVTFQDGYVTPASLVGADVFTDLAVIAVSVEPVRLMPVTFGDSSAIHVGERAIAIGNPFGLSSSMTVGIISGLGRQLPSAELMGSESAAFRNPLILQVDARINPGSSGGLLLNSRGEVIGVTTAIRTESGTFEGVGFAVPASSVLRVIPELIAAGQVAYPWLGVGSITAEQGFGVAGLAGPLNLPVMTGVLVAGVAPRSPAARAGIQGGTREVVVRGRQVCAGGDIIVAIDGIFVNSMDELLAHLMMDTRPGDITELTIARDGYIFTLPVRLETRPSSGADVPACGAAE